MTKKVKTALLFLIIAIVAAVVLFVFAPKFKKGKDTPEDVINAYMENLKEAESLSAGGTLNAEINAMGAAVPVEITLDLKTDAKDRMYLCMNADISFMGMSVNETDEFYSETDGNTVYTYRYDEYEETWTYTAEEKESDVSVEDTVREYMEKLKESMELEKSGEGYEITVDLSTLDKDTVNGIFAAGSEAESDIIPESADTVSGKVVLTFDTDCYLTDININLTAVTAETEESPAGEISLAGKIEAEYDTLSESDYSLSDDIKESAVMQEAESYDTATGTDAEEDTGENTGNTQAVDEWGNVITGSSQGEADIEISSEENTSEAAENPEPETTEGTDTEGNTSQPYGIKIDGMDITLPVPYSVFTENGWAVSFSDYGIDETYSVGGYQRIADNIEMWNENYENPITIGLENRTESGKVITDCNIWSMDIKNNGQTSPAIDINGVTWASGEDAVNSCLGAYTDREEYSDGYVNIYERADGDLKVTLKIYVTAGEITEISITRE